jgi:polysaccharide export outer membrane protein
MLRPALALALAASAILGCGTPPNQRLLTRTSDYLKAMSYGFDTGHPFDLEILVRKFPELKGIVMTAPEWVDEYERLKREADARGEAVYEYRIPYGASVTIEVTGEKDLTRNYFVPPTGYVHYPFVNKLRVAGLTLDELKAHLERELALYLKRPEVLVHVHPQPWHHAGVGGGGGGFFQNNQGSDIVVMGITRLPIYSTRAFTGRETLVNILGTSDLPPNAEWRQIRVIRRDPKDPLRKSRVIVCDLWDYFAKADVRQDIPLAPGDVIFVPQRWSTDDQFWEDWGYVKRVMSDVLFLDAFKDAAKKGGTLRD